MAPYVAMINSPRVKTPRPSNIFVNVEIGGYPEADDSAGKSTKPSNGITGPSSNSDADRSRNNEGCAIVNFATGHICLTGLKLHISNLPNRGYQHAFYITKVLVSPVRFAFNGCKFGCIKEPLGKFRLYKATKSNISKTDGSFIYEKEAVQRRYLERYYHTQDISLLQKWL